MDSNTTGVPASGTQPQKTPDLSGRVLFYNKPEPLSLESHRNLGVKRLDTPFMFLRTAHAVPVTVSEFGVASASFPIIFVGADKTPVAVMGVRQGENEFVDVKGQPDPDHYVPAFARRYPFVFASDDNADRLLLCIDREASMITDKPDVPFFEGDEPSKFTQDAIEFCKEFERQRRATMDFVQLLTEMDLLEQKSVSFTPRDQSGQEGAQQKIADYWAVSEERLNNLSDEKFLQLKNTGAMGAVYAHMVSLLNWPRVIQRALRRLQTAPAGAAPAAGGGQQAARPAGQQPQGQPQRPQGAAPQAPRPAGQPPQGQPPRPAGQPPQGQPPRPQGAAPQAPRPAGQPPQGQPQRPQGAAPQAPRPAGQPPQGVPRPPTNS